MKDNKLGIKHNKLLNEWVTKFIVVIISQYIHAKSLGCTA